MKALILYSSRDGQTRAIASYIASKLQDTLRCEVIDLLQAEQVDLNQYQLVMIGASIRYGHFNPVLDKFVKRHAEQLNRMPSAFFAVNLTARKPEKRSPQTNAYTRKFLLTSPWQPKQCAVFAGALRYPRYRWFDRIMIQFIMRMTGGETDTSKEVEYTDWQQVDRFAQEFSHIPYEK
ncbi:MULTISPECIES: menaquinone-dependent protoporphyrinogen IX dehydrogenase [Serratia]|uniref:menaquinone-dependent protoporphyrinogen IX dehydrogenase n=1 Tax=Serratia TaxID=613 RepID=UPI000744E8F3|nr:menaquinone-dependent protoporphyrinogen IX dehydrogenase [Serratia marcescens]MBH2711775.1 menaquinone-dependent protoporphyrinogen IX dehydrogenase [Serratia marcescens]MDQ9393416.1 menaquinone-dependent protoporphyrinogen IX dehydrogenase [Serratia marcescens]MDQ9407867.1 menaquinone-dependent protoporphyrinogen IX dehydrogenase [Serratia marcescens]MDQ9498469.1 menaquinone-dependent protoporphyrinogen IX dehydrogenase [Serratia marcescens]MDQ9505163.1 menaquinone-dependent protoporphyri